MPHRFCQLFNVTDARASGSSLCGSPRFAVSNACVNNKNTTPDTKTETYESRRRKIWMLIMYKRENFQSSRNRGPLLVNERLIHIVEYVRVGSLKGYRDHARRHGRRKLEMLRNSIRECGGILVPVLATADGTLITGHARVMALIQLGASEVPVIRVTHLTPEQIRAYRIADNRPLRAQSRQRLELSRRRRVQPRTPW
jgi:hypothetical protein